MTIIIYCNGQQYYVAIVAPGDTCPECGKKTDDSGRIIHVPGGDGCQKEG